MTSYPGSNGILLFFLSVFTAQNMSFYFAVIYCGYKLPVSDASLNLDFCKATLRQHL